MSQEEPARLPDGARAELARAVARAVDGVDGVRRSGGTGVEVATMFSGGSILGIRLGDDQVGVHITTERLPLPPVIEEVRERATGALRAVGDPRAVAVTVDDVNVERLPGGVA